MLEFLLQAVVEFFGDFVLDVFFRFLSGCLCDLFRWIQNLF